mgnify:CR=1 FL=1
MSKLFIIVGVIVSILMLVAGQAMPALVVLSVCILLSIIFKKRRSKMRHISSLANVHTGEDFERYVAGLLAASKRGEVTLTPRSSDYGVDIILQTPNEKDVFQCKYYSKPVGVSAVQEVYAGKLYYGADYAYVITNTSYTKNAQALARQTGVRLWTVTELQNKLASSIKQQKKKVKKESKQAAKVQEQTSANLNISVRSVSEISADPLYSRAVDVVRHYNEATTRILQQELHIDFYRAYDLLHQLEDNHVIKRSYEGNRVLSNGIPRTEEPLRGKNPYYDKAIDVINFHNKVDVTLLQRDLHIGWRHAYLLILQMEANGIVERDLRGRFVITKNLPSSAPNAKQNIKNDSPPFGDDLDDLLEYDNIFEDENGNWE